MTAPTPAVGWLTLLHSLDRRLFGSMGCSHLDRNICGAAASAGLRTSPIPATAIWLVINVLTAEAPTDWGGGSGLYNAFVDGARLGDTVSL